MNSNSFNRRMAAFDTRQTVDPTADMIRASTVDQINYNAATQGIIENYALIDDARQREIEARQRAIQDAVTDENINPFEEFATTFNDDFTGIVRRNTSDSWWKEEAYQQAAMKDPGGILGTSLRSTSAKFAGAANMFAQLPPEFRGQTEEFLEALRLGTGSDGTTNNWGWDIEGTGLGKLVAGTYDFVWGETGHMRGMEPGTPLFNQLNGKDPRWTEEMRAAFADTFFNNETSSLYAVAGITREDIMKSESLGAATAMMLDKTTAYSAGKWHAQASGWDSTSFFVGNLGRTMMGDPDVVAELGIALAATAVSGVGGVAYLGGRGATSLGTKAATTAAAHLGRGAALRRITMLTDGLQGAGKGLMAAGRATTKAGGLGAKANPFQIAENFVMPAVRDLRIISRISKEGGRAGYRKQAQLQRLIDQGIGGVGGVVLRNVFGETTSRLSLKSGIAANMMDGAIGNMGAYIMSRDEEYRWAKMLYGDDVTWQNYRASVFGNVHQGGFPNSIVGSALMGAGFGMVVGGGLRVLGAARFKAEEMTNIGADGIPLAQDPIKAMYQNITAYNKYARGEDTSSYLNKLIAGDKARTISMGSEQLTRGFMAKGLDAETASRRGQMFANLAFNEGLDLGTMLRNITEDGVIDPQKALAYVRKHGQSKEARARRRARRMFDESGTKRSEERGLARFNAERLQRLLDSGDDWDSASHGKILDEIIDSFEEGDAKESLKRYRDALRKESDEVVDGLAETVETIRSGGPDMDPKEKQAFIDAVLSSLGLDKLVIKIEDIEAKLAGRDLEAVRTEIEGRVRAEREAEILRLKEEARVARAAAEAAERRSAEGIESELISKDELVDAWEASTAKAEEAEADLRTAEDTAPDEVTVETADKMSLTEAIRSLVEDKVVDERLKGSIEASVIHMPAARAEVAGEKIPTAGRDIREVVGATIFQKLIDLSDSVEYDARSGTVRYSLKDMADNTRKQANYMRAALSRKDEDGNLVPSKSLKAVTEETETKLRERLYGMLKANGKIKAKPLAEFETKVLIEKMSKVELVNLLRDEFDIDLNADLGGATVVKGKNLSKKQLGDLYLDMAVLRFMDNQSSNVRRLLAKKMIKEAEAEGGSVDPMILMAAGDWATNMDKLSAILKGVDGLKPDADGFATTAAFIQIMPQNLHGLLHTVFREAEDTSTGRFHVETVRAIAQERLARTHASFNRAFRNQLEERMAQMQPGQRSTFFQMHRFENEVAQTEEFLRAQADMIADDADYHQRIRAARQGDMPPEAYMRQQRELFARGVYDAWVATPKAIKDRLDARLRKAGLSDMSRAKGKWNEADEEFHADFGEAIWAAMQEELGLDLGDIEAQWSGARNSVDGNTAGRALIEAFTNYSPEDGSFIGRASNDKIVNLYKQHVGESVRLRAIQEMQNADMDKINAMIDFYDGLGKALDDVGGDINKLEPKYRDAINEVRYNSATTHGLAPADIIKDLTGNLKSFRKTFDDRVAMVTEMPVTVMSTLHDEFKVFENAHASVFGVGVIPGGKQGLSPKVSGDAGFGGAAFTPGSALHFITLRSGQMFGTVRGLSDAASHYGMNQLSKWLGDNDAHTVINGIDEIHNSRDASAQATTIGQLIARDYAAKYGEKAAQAFVADQRAFKQTLDEISDMLMDRAGGRELKSNLDEALDKYLTNTQKDELYDNYSAAGMAALNKGIKGWEGFTESALISTESRAAADEAKTEYGGDRVAPKADTPLGAIVRDKLFKPPVMTIVYSAGKKTFTKSAINAIDEIIEAATKDPSILPEGISLDGLKANKFEMAKSWTDAMFGKEGAIAQTLNIPDSKTLIEMVQRDDIVLSSGERIPMETFLNSDWIGNDDLRPKIATYLQNEAELEFGISDVNLGLWLVKLRRSSKGDTLKSIEFMKKELNKAKLDKEGNKRTKQEQMDALRAAWKPVSGFLKSIESANRTAHTLDPAVMERALALAGIRFDDLDPMTQRMIKGVAHYDRNYAGAGRKVSPKDSTMAVRAQDLESKDKKKYGGAQVAQAILQDSHRAMFGGSDDLKMNARRAVMADMMFEVGPFVLPPDFKPPRMGDFIKDVHAYNASDNSLRARMEAPEKLNTRMKQLEAAKREAEGEELDAINEELGFITAVSKTLFSKDDTRFTQRAGEEIHVGFRNEYGSHHFANNVQAHRRLSTATSHFATDLGVADMRAAKFSLHNREAQMARRDQAWLADKSMDPFSFSELTTASPIAPEFVNAARAAAPPEAPPRTATIGDEELLTRQTSRSRKSIMTENGEDKALAERSETTPAVVRMDRLANRLAEQTAKNRTRMDNTWKGEEAQEAKATAHRRQIAAQILIGFRNTFGNAIGEQETKSNMFKIKSDGVISGQSESMFGAVSDLIVDAIDAGRDPMENLQGWLAGPQHAAGLFLNRMKDTLEDHFGPQSVAMAPLSVFARDYKILGTAARDLPAVTVVRIAREMGRSIEDVIDEVNSRGFFRVHEDFIFERYGGLKTPDQRMEYEINSQGMMALISDYHAGKLGEIKIDNENILRELGVAEGALTDITIGEAVEFRSLIKHFEDNPHMREALEETLGQKFSAHDLAANLALSRDNLAKLLSDGESPLVVPRVDGDGKAVTGVVDYVNGMEVVDHNIVPGRGGEIPLYTEPQMLHMLNLSANRQLVRNLINANMFGIEFDPKAELDFILKDTSSDFSSEGTVHGFTGQVNSMNEARGLQGLTQKERPLDAWGDRAVRNYGLNDQVPHGEREIFAMAMLIHDNGLAKGNEITPEGKKLLIDSKVGGEKFTDADVLAAAETHLELIMDKRIDAWEAQGAANAKAKSAAETEVAVEEAASSGRMSPVDTPVDDHGNPLPMEDAGVDVDRPIMDVIEETHPVTELSPPLITDPTPDMDVRLGNMFLANLKHRADVDGDIAAANAAKGFEILTGRDGSENGISNAEAMAVIEVSWIDPDLRQGLWGGELDIVDGGDLRVDFQSTMEGRLRSRLAGLNRVKKALKDDGVPAAAYLFTHELVERMDVYNIMRGRNSNSAKMNGHKSSVGRLFIENFATTKGQQFWIKAFEELGVYDDKMKKFMRAADDLANDAKYWDTSTIAEANAAGARAGKIDRAVVTEGFTQVITMALMHKNGTRVADVLKTHKMHELKDIGGAIAHKLHKVKSYLEDYGVVTRTAEAHSKAGGFLRDNDQMDKVYNMIGDIARNVKHEKLTRNPEVAEFSRFWGGKGDGVPMGDRSIGDVKMEIKALEAKLPVASTRGRTVIQLQLNELRMELHGMTNDPRYVMEAEKADAMFDEMADKDGLVDLREMTEAEADGMVNKKIDDLLSKVDTQRSSLVGRTVNALAGKFSAGAGLAAGNSKFDSIRGLWGLINPESLHVKANRNDNWMSDQLAVDALSSDKRAVMAGMDLVRRRLKKQTGGKSPGDAEKMQQAVTEFFEGADPSVLNELGFTANEINTLIKSRDHLMDPKTGFLVRLAEALHRTGKISQTDLDKFRARPRIPRGFKKDMVTPANAVEIRGHLSKAAKRHLMREQPRMDVADMLGLTMDKSKDSAQRQAEYNALPEGLRNMYDDIAMKMPESRKPENFDKLPDYERAQVASDYFKSWSSTPPDMRPALKVDMSAFDTLYRNQLELDESLPGTDRGGKSRIQAMFEEKYAKTLMQDPHTPTSVLDGLAHLEMVSLKQGTRLTESKYVGHIDDVVAVEPDLSKFMNYNPQQSMIQLLSSNAPRAWSAAIQQKALGIKGGSTFMVIDNLRKRAETGQHLPGVEPHERAAFLQELAVLEDQVRAGWDMRPRGMEVIGDAERNVASLSRLAVSSVSAGNFALSAIAEVFSTTARSLGRLMVGDFATLGDYFASASPAARREALTQINGWETAKMELGMRSRMGDMGVESLEDMLNKESGRTGVDKFEDFTRGVQRFSMLGMRQFTEYSRAIVARQSIRDVKRRAMKRSFSRLGEAFTGLGPEASLKEVRGAARKAGMDPQLAVSLWQNGMVDFKLLKDMQYVFGDNKMFGKDGLDIDRFHQVYRGKADSRLRAAITHVLQFENNKVNLDTRIGNRTMPKNLVEQMLSTLAQYPNLFYSRMRQGAWQGGTLAGAGLIVGPLLLGELYYLVLSEMAREGDAEILERIKKNPQGVFMKLLSNANFMGSFSPIQTAVINKSIDLTRTASGNEAFLEGFKTHNWINSPINAAGAQMFVSGLDKMGRATGQLFEGEYAEAAKTGKDLLPVTGKQIWRGALNYWLEASPEGRALSQAAGDPPPPMAPAAPRAVPEGLLAQPGNQVPPPAKAAQGTPEGLSANLNSSTVTGAEFNDAMKGI